MRIQADLELSSPNNLEGLFFDAAIISGGSSPDMKARDHSLRCAADTDWDMYRDAIVSLYRDQDLPLKEVISHMERDYGFRSTPKVYKTKISEWNVQKNLTRDQRSRAILAVEKFVNKHGYAPQLTFNGKPVPLSRLSRRSVGGHPIASRKRTQRWRSLSVDQTIELNDFLSPSVEDDTDLQQSSSPSPELVLTPPPETSHHDKLLKAISVFTVFCADAYFPIGTDVPTTINLDFDGDLDASQAANSFWSSVISALNQLEQGQSAFSELDKACQSVTVFMQTPPTSLFRRLLITLGNERWSQFPDFRHQLFIFLAQMANKSLGPLHPVTIALAEMVKQDTLLYSAEAVMRIALEEAEVRLGPTHVEALWTKRSYARILRRQGEAETAERMLLASKQQCEIATGPYSRQTRIILEGLGQLYMQEDRLEDAEAVLVELVRKSEPRTPTSCQSCGQGEKTMPGHIVLYAKRSLCFLAKARGDRLLEDYWYAKEMEMVGDFGLDELAILGIRKYQERRLFATGKFRYMTHLKGYVMPVPERQKGEEWVDVVDWAGTGVFGNKEPYDLGLIDAVRPSDSVGVKSCGAAKNETWAMNSDRGGMR